MHRPILWVTLHWRGLLLSLLAVFAYGYAGGLELEHICSQPGVVCT
jgi:hypothetical protein